MVSLESLQALPHAEAAFGRDVHHGPLSRALISPLGTGRDVERQVDPTEESGGVLR